MDVVKQTNKQTNKTKQTNTRRMLLTMQGGRKQQQQQTETKMTRYRFSPYNLPCTDVRWKIIPANMI